MATIIGSFSDAAAFIVVRSTKPSAFEGASSLATLGFALGEPPGSGGDERQAASTQRQRPRRNDETRRNTEWRMF
jgi:hypothetical protein